MANKNRVLGGVDADFAKAMREISKIRISKGLAQPTPKEISLKENTRLLMRTDGWKISLEELKTKPKRK